MWPDNHHSHERTFNKRPTNHIDFIWPKAFGQIDRKWLKPCGSQAQRFEVQPQISVVSRFEQEVPLS
ncbi:MAG: hypothetical protein ABGZ24_13040 [Fuerstiella sp.]